MNRKAKEIKRGVRLNIKKPPKVETPKNVYTRKTRHKKGYDEKIHTPFYFLFPLPLNYLQLFF